VYQIPNAFTDNKKVIKSHIPTMNTLIKINIPKEQLTSTIANKSKTRLKRERLVGCKRHSSLEEKATIIK